MKSDVLPVTVITTCYGRNHHLYNLLMSLEAGSVRPDEVVIVNDDAEQDRLEAFDLNIIKIPTTEVIRLEAINPQETALGIDKHDKVGFDIGKNRNLGADKASYELLIFLDVDCIVSHTFIAGLSTKLTTYSNAVLMAQPRYLTRPLTLDERQKLSDKQADDDWLNEMSVLNPYRHNMVDIEGHSKDAIQLTDDYGAFWSLCFAIKKTMFKRIGGFDTDYIGYGAEDTDFAFTARELDIPMYLTNDVAYHQQHSVYRPPINHLSSIIVNANLFYKKWQHWPMGGWLQEFNDMGLIDWVTTQQTPLSIRRLPNDKELTMAHCPDAPFV